MTREELIKASFLKIPVIFGRKHGEKTVGLIVKVNDTRCRIKILQDRGIKSKAGQEWNVYFSGIREATEQEIAFAKQMQEAFAPKAPTIPGSAPLSSHPLFSKGVGKPEKVVEISSDGLLALLG